jgi:hypothetical protein
MTTTTISPTPNIIRELRKQLHLTQQEVAERAGVSRYYLGRLERGEVSLTVEGRTCPTCGHKPQGLAPEVGQVLRAMWDHIDTAGGTS